MCTYKQNTHKIIKIFRNLSNKIDALSSSKPLKTEFKVQWWHEPTTLAFRKPKEVYKNKKIMKKKKKRWFFHISGHGRAVASGLALAGNGTCRWTGQSTEVAASLAVQLKSSLKGAAKPMWDPQAEINQDLNLTPSLKMSTNGSYSKKSYGRNCWELRKKVLRYAVKSMINKQMMCRPQQNVKLMPVETLLRWFKYKLEEDIYKSQIQEMTCS